MENIKLTDLEKKVLKQIKDELEYGWEDIDNLGTGIYTCCWNPFIENTKPEIKGALGSLVKKGIISIYDGEEKNDAILVNDVKYLDLV